MTPNAIVRRMPWSPAMAAEAIVGSTANTRAAARATTSFESRIVRLGSGLASR